MPAANALNAFMASQGYRQDQEDRQRAAQERQRAIGLDNTRGKINALMMQPELGAVGGRLPASNISAEEITSAARGAGMAENNPSLNRVVDGINQGLSPDQAAQRAAQGAGQRQASRADQMRQLAIGSADPEIMSQVQQALAGMSAQEQQDAARRLRGQRAAALTLLDMPEADRALWVRQNRPTIESVGLTVEQVLSQPLNDQNLTAHVRMAQGLDDELFAGITGPQTLGESDTRVDMLSGRQAIGQAGSEARALESRGLDISQQNADTSRIQAQRPASPLVNVQTGQTVDPFQARLAEAEGDQFASFLGAGAAAQRNLAQINRLESLLGQTNAGGGAALQLIAGNFGIETDGLSELQAAEALINAMVPAQRPPGSGPMSDSDLELFKRSLPRIINQPGGNERILETLRGIAQYDIQLGNIAARASSGEITREQARAEVNSLSNPLASTGAQRMRYDPQSGGLVPVE